PQELRVRGIRTMEAANEFLRTIYIADFNDKFARSAEQIGTAFVPLQRQDLDRVFSIQHERIVHKDNTVRWATLSLQIEPNGLRSTMADQTVMVYEHLDQTISLGYGPHLLNRYSSSGVAITDPQQCPKPKRSKKPVLREVGTGFSLNKVTSAARS